MAKWKCPNKAGIPEHKEKILFEGESSAATVPYMQVPKPAYCDICDRFYTRDECTKVES